MPQFGGSGAKTVFAHRSIKGIRNSRGVAHRFGQRCVRRHGFLAALSKRASPGGDDSPAVESSGTQFDPVVVQCFLTFAQAELTTVFAAAGTTVFLAV